MLEPGIVHVIRFGAGAGSAFTTDREGKLCFVIWPHDERDYQPFREYGVRSRRPPPFLQPAIEAVMRRR